MKAATTRTFWYRRSAAWLISLNCLIMLGARPATLTAQFSPGKLAKSHAFLEGLDNCTKCHVLGAKTSEKNCLSCHRELDARLTAGQGYHGQVVLREGKSCFKCHGEHAGRSFELVYWPEGQENFDHALTGHVLEGKHRSLKCRDCHKPDLIRDDPRRHYKKVDVRRTFLGLRTDCLSCHQDEHREQLGTDCLKCHTQDAWKPAAGFDHNRAQFRLTGKHQPVKCLSCHPRVRDARARGSAKPAFTRFRGLEFRSCQSCHQDVHKGKLGAKCQKCHQTSGWRTIRRGGFDHSLTRFPLRGLHAAVDCSKCHTGAQLRKQLRYSRCDDCHRDPHRGQFKQREDGGKCEACHSEQGFTPSSFTAARHEKTRFSLTGAHLAAPCIACHKIITSGREGKHRIFRMTDMRCTACHEDAHRGQLAERVAQGGCESCHTTDRWSETKFDHNTSRFRLEGKHADVACRKCHKNVDQGTPKERILFKPISAGCRDCHKDAHAGQFSRVNPMKACEVCHTPLAWQVLKFKHDRDTRFTLEGAHKMVACEACHKPVRVRDLIFIQYRGIDPACQTCHAGSE